MAWTIARPTLDDLDELGRVHVQVWREAYAGLLPDEYLAGLDPTFGPRRWRERFGTTPEVSWWLARDEEGIIGMSTSGPARDDDAPLPLELYAINVLQRGHGTGVSDDLMKRDRRPSGVPLGARRQRPRAGVLPSARFRRRGRPQARARHRRGRDPDVARGHLLVRDR